jgi:potassium-transporting ATPase KdpC subunit
MNQTAKPMAQTLELTPISDSDASPEPSLWLPALKLFILLSIITGIAYPLAVTSIAQLLMPAKANGGLIQRDEQMVGAALIGQAFSGPNYFWSRPSATGPVPYNASASSGSNLGPSNPALHSAVAERVTALRAAHPMQLDANGAPARVPVDLVTSSASGLDPHISVAAANYQLARVADARGLPAHELQALVDQHTLGVQFGFLGEPRVNVLELNLALDALGSANP